MITLHVGDCREVMATMDAESVDAIVTDPPYGIVFMEKGWDHGVPGEEFWREALRVAKPGAHLLAFGGTRTFHRLAVAIEDAGWQIRDTIMWVYGSGMPKSYDAGKAIDARLQTGAAGGSRDSDRKGEPSAPLTTEEAQRWQGWGTALKPAVEPIIVARKPIWGTIVDNILRYGTGAMNIDGTRVPHGDDVDLTMVQRQGAQSAIYVGGAKPGDVIAMYKPGGRWPANLIHDGSDEVLAYFPSAPSAGKYTDPSEPKQHGIRGGDRSKNLFTGNTRRDNNYAGETGTAARFFYSAKASKADRTDGCEENNHPTVKPTELMRYLVRLVTPPGGITLDPFCGSGSTGRGAVLEGASFIGIDLSEEYIEIARRRIAAAERTVQITPQQEPLL